MKGYIFAVFHTSAMSAYKIPPILVDGTNLLQMGLDEPSDSLVLGLNTYIGGISSRSSTYEQVFLSPAVLGLALLPAKLIYPELLQEVLFGCIPAPVQSCRT